MDTQFFSHAWRTVTVHKRPAIFQRATDGASERTCPNIPVRWATSKRAALPEGHARLSPYFATQPHPKASKFRPMYDQSSLISSADHDWTLMGVPSPIKFHEGIEYGSRSQSAAVDEVEESAGGEEGEAEWAKDAVNVTHQRGAAAPEGGGVVGFAYGGQHGSDGAYPPAPDQPVGQWGPRTMCAATSKHQVGPAPVYVATTTNPAGPDGVLCAPMREMLDGGGREFAGVLSALTEKGWRGVTIRDVLNVVSKLYDGYRKGLHSRDEAARWRGDFYNLRNEHREKLATSTGIEIVGRSQVAPAEVEKWHGKVSQAPTDVENVCSDMEAARIANLALRRDL